MILSAVKAKIRVLGVLGALLSPYTVFAQSADAESEQSAGRQSILEEIIVTATKRSQSLQDTAVAASAFSTEDILTRDIKTVSDLQIQVPNMTVGGSGIMFVSIRGVGFNNALGIGEPGIATHMDGIYLSRPTMQGLVFEDLERIEVVRGPQGTLYGRNATGGAINFISKDAQAEPAAEVSVTAGNYDTLSTKGFITGAIGAGKNLLGRLTWLYGERDSYWEDAVTGDNAYKDKNMGLNAKISYETESELMINAQAFYRKDHVSSFAAGATTLPITEFPNGGGLTIGGLNGLNDPGVNATTKPFKQQNTDEFYAKTTTQGAILNLEKDFGDITVRSLTGYIDHSAKYSRDLDGTDVNLILQINDETTKTLSTELVFLGDAENWNWLVGLYALADDFKPNTTATFPLGLFAPAGFFAPIPITLDATSLFTPNTEAETTSYAVFGETNYELTETITLNAGLRFTRDEIKFTQTYGLSSASPLFDGPLLECEDLENNASWSEWTPKVGIKYQRNDQMMVYANVSQGYKAGGFNTSACGDDFEPETLDAYEIGLKTSLLDDTLRLNFAAFVYDYDDLQLYKQVGVQAFVENASSADVSGLEMDGQWLITDGLVMDVNAAYLDATYGEFSGINQLDPGSGEIDLEGNTLNRSPKWSGSIGLQYTTPLEWSSITARAEYAYKDKMFYNEFNDVDVSQSSYTLLNLYLILDTEKLSTRLYVKNVNDTDYSPSMSALNFTGGVIGAYGDPRTYGVELTYSF